jgi:YVTN family beta-propeller protein
MATRGTVTTGSGPHGVVIDTSGRWAWVTNSFDNTVSTIDLAALSVAATIPVGKGPNGISFSPEPPASIATNRTILTIPVPPANSQWPAPSTHSP